MILLSDDICRSDFIENYTFFKTDGHTKIYKDFIDKTDIGKKNDRISEAIELAENIDYCSKKLISLIRRVLFSRKNFFLKLTSLDYQLSQSHKINGTTYIMLNNKHNHSKNEFLKLQSNINLLVTENSDKSQKHIIKVLKKAPYPNIFYRFFNAIEYNIETFKKHINSQLLQEVMQIAESKNFSPESKEEIKRITTILINQFPYTIPSKVGYN